MTNTPCGEGRPDGSTCGTTPTRLYTRGHRCQTCAPEWHTASERRALQLATS